MQIRLILTLFLTTVFLFSTYSQENDKYTLFEKDGYDFPYDLSEPDKEWKLPKKLVEISGLSTIDKNRLACVQDEKGNVYIFNLKEGEVESKIDFGDDGDYEGIELIGDDAWVLKSNGTLFEVSDFLNEENPTSTKHPTELSKKNDAEGLAYDPVSHSLLIACKGHPFLEKKEGKEFKALYSFNLKSKKLNLNPFLLIEMDTIKYYKNYNTMTELGIELLAYFDDSKGDLSFQPSGIAIHPLTGHFYILGSVGNLLMVFSRENEMLAMIKLRSKYYAQPEGLCFGPDRKLYIANEGDEKAATILMFKAKKPF
jgi:uncharacterized protein YjiK